MQNRTSLRGGRTPRQIKGALRPQRYKKRGAPRKHAPCEQIYFTTAPITVLPVREAPVWSMALTASPKAGSSVSPRIFSSEADMPYWRAGFASPSSTQVFVAPPLSPSGLSIEAGSNAAPATAIPSAL